jgi:hypothetical protein
MALPMRSIRPSSETDSLLQTTEGFKFALRIETKLLQIRLFEVQEKPISHCYGNYFFRTHGHS